MKLDKNTFFELQKKLEVIPFTQTEEWLMHSYEHVMERMHFFVDADTDPHVAAFGHLHSRKLLGSRLLFNGICKSKGCTSEHIRLFFKSIVDEGYDMVRVSDIDEYDPNFEVGIRRAGLVRPMGISLCPMSMIVDLQKPFNFNRNWRRNVKKARENGCSFRVIENPTMENCNQFVRLFGELKQRKGLGFSLSPDSLITLFQGSYKMFAVQMGGETICSRISYINNGLIYDVYAANSDEAIKVGAAYLIQEEIFQYFKEQGYEQFDYGRIPPSIGKMDNIYVAKSHSGGRPIGYNGEWEYSNKLWRRYFYSLHSFAYGHATLY